MKFITNVTGSKEQAKPLIVGKDTVYVHSNIKEVEKDGIQMYQYDEWQYEKDEYIEKISSQNDTLLMDLDFRLTMIEMGLQEV